MFPGNTKPKLEAGVLRSGRIFRSGKRRNAKEGQRNPILFKETEHKLQSQRSEGSCDEEEDYSPILEGAEDSEESHKTPRSGRNYITPGISLEVRYRVLSP